MRTEGDLSRFQQDISTAPTLSESNNPKQEEVSIFDGRLNRREFIGLGVVSVAIAAAGLDGARRIKNLDELSERRQQIYDDYKSDTMSSRNSPIAEDSIDRRLTEIEEENLYVVNDEKRKGIVGISTAVVYYSGLILGLGYFGIKKISEKINFKQNTNSESISLPQEEQGQDLMR